MARCQPVCIRNPLTWTRSCIPVHPASFFPAVYEVSGNNSPISFVWVARCVVSCYSRRLWRCIETRPTPSNRATTCRSLQLLIELINSKVDIPILSVRLASMQLLIRFFFLSQAKREREVVRGNTHAVDEVREFITKTMPSFRYYVVAVFVLLLFGYYS